MRDFWVELKYAIVDNVSARAEPSTLFAARPQLVLENQASDTSLREERLHLEELDSAAISSDAHIFRLDLAWLNEVSKAWWHGHPATHQVQLSASPWSLLLGLNGP